jgi:hypothetical protein
MSLPGVQSVTGHADWRLHSGKISTAGATHPSFSGNKGRSRKKRESADVIWMNQEPER